MTPLDDILAKLEKTKQTGQGYAAFCPAHGDTKTRHLTVKEAEDGRVLMHCHHGCTFLEVCQALDIEPQDAFPKPVKDGDAWLFHARDAKGNLVATHHRRKSKDGSKRVWWSTEAGKGLGGMLGSSLPLWGAEAVESVPQDRFIVVTEGEKAAYFLTRNFIPAVGTMTGASGTPGDEPLEVLKDRPVVLWPDADEEGRQHMDRIAKALQGVAKEVRVYEWPEAEEKWDAADHPAIVRRDPEGVTSLREDLEIAPLWKPRPDRKGLSQAEVVREEIERWISGENLIGIRTGMTRLDNEILGLSPGRSYVIAGAPGDGKSLFCGQIGLTAAYQHKRVAIFSIESSAVEYVQRTVCYMSGVDYFAAIAGRLTEEHKDKLRAEYERLNSLPWMITDIGAQTPSFMREQVERHQPDLVVVDYLQYASPDMPSGNRVQDLDEISRQVTSLKSDYNIPVLLAEQINRDSRSVNKEPELHSLRGSGGLEQDADVVMFLHRKTEESGELSEDTKLLCRKNRIAKRFTMNLMFAEGQQWFLDAEEHKPPFDGGRKVVSYSD